jgi:translocation and assembly module TamB
VLAFAQSVTDFHVTIGDKNTKFEDISVRVGAQGHTRVKGRVTLNYDVRVGIEVQAIGDALDLSDFGEIAEISWSGLGQAQISVMGPYSHILVEGQTTLRDFKFRQYSLGIVQSQIRYSSGTLKFQGIAAQKGQTQYFGDLALDFKDSGIFAHASVQLPDGRVEDVIEILADLSPTMNNVRDGVLTGRLSLLLAIDGPVSNFAGIIAARFREVAYWKRHVGEAEMVAQFVNGEALVLEPMAFTGPLGALTLGGKWNFSGPLNFDFAVKKGSLFELIDVGETPVRGEFQASAHVGGTTDVIVSQAALSSDEVTYQGKKVGPAHLEAASREREARINGTLFTGVSAALSIKMQNQWPFQATLNIHREEFDAFLPANAGVNVKAEGEVKIDGPMRAWRSSNGTVFLSKLSLARGEVSASNTEPVEASIRNGAMEVKSLKMAGPTMDFMAEGRWAANLVDLKSRGTLDLRLISSLTDTFERASGKLEFTANFLGTAKSPTLSGNADLSDGRLVAKGQDIQIRGLSGHAEFSSARILIDRLDGFANDGKLNGRGDIRLNGLSISQVELETELEDVTVQVQPEVPATLSGTLLLASRDAKKYQLSGFVDVTKMRYLQPLSFYTVMERARAKTIPEEQKPSEWLRYDVDIASAGDVRIENNLARARILGKLKLSGTNVNPLLVGAVEFGDGAQAFLPPRQVPFKVQRGLLQFNGLWPTFDLSAQAQVREYLVRVKAFGRLEDPRIALSSEPSLAEADILSLLSLGVTTRERFAEAGAGLAAEALLSASGLDQQVQRFLSQTAGLKDQRVRLTTSFNDSSGTVEPAVSWESKVVSDNLKLSVTAPVSGKGIVAEGEYLFNSKVSLRPHWDNKTQNTTVGNPGLELRFRFEWE